MFIVVINKESLICVICISCVWCTLLGYHSDEIENWNVTASAVSHIDESGDLERLSKRKPKKKRRHKSRHYPTGKKERNSFGSVFCRLYNEIMLLYIHKSVMMVFWLPDPGSICALNLKMKVSILW